jgi:hypothetical protein
MGPRRRGWRVLGGSKAGRRGGDRRSAARDEGGQCTLPAGARKLPFNRTCLVRAWPNQLQRASFYVFPPPTFGSLRSKGINHQEANCAEHLFKGDRFWGGFAQVNEMPRGEQVRTVMISIWYSHHVTPCPFQERKLCTCAYGQQGPLTWTAAQQAGEEFSGTTERENEKAGRREFQEKQKWRIPVNPNHVKAKHASGNLFWLMDIESISHSSRSRFIF